MGARAGRKKSICLPPHISNRIIEFAKVFSKRQSPNHIWCDILDRWNRAVIVVSIDNKLEQIVMYICDLLPLDVILSRYLICFYGGIFLFIFFFTEWGFNHNIEVIFDMNNGLGLNLWLALIWKLLEVWRNMKTTLTSLCIWVCCWIVLRQLCIGVTNHHSGLKCMRIVYWKLVSTSIISHLHSIANDWYGLS